jgi:hypothetical protein
MMRTRKTWREKLADSKGLPSVKKLSGKWAQRLGRGTIAIPAPSEVDELMKQVPRGQVTTIKALCATLAKRHSATIGCPITTGIFAWIAAHAAEEAASAGSKRITPYWRTLKNGGELNPKYPGGIEGIKARLEAEGHRIVSKGKRFFLANFSDPLA